MLPRAAAPVSLALDGWAIEGAPKDQEAAVKLPWMSLKTPRVALQAARLVSGLHERVCSRCSFCGFTIPLCGFAPDWRRSIASEPTDR